MKRGHRSESGTPVRMVRQLLSDEVGQFLFECWFGPSTYDRLGDFPILEDIERRDRGDPICRGGLHIVVRVDLYDLELVRLLLADLIDDRANHAARAAPWCPKVDEDGLIRLENLCFES